MPDLGSGDSSDRRNTSDGFGRLRWIGIVVVLGR